MPFPPEYTLEEEAQIKQMCLYLRNNTTDAKVQAFIQAYEALQQHLEHLFPEDTSHTDEEWCDYPADAAIQRFRFWWTWGN